MTCSIYISVLTEEFNQTSIESQEKKYILNINKLKLFFFLNFYKRMIIENFNTSLAREWSRGVCLVKNPSASSIKGDIPLKELREISVLE